MSPEELAQSAADQQSMPEGLSPTARVLWLAQAGEWDRAHDDCQSLADTAAGSWIHAWLHRQQGDYGNACYWYRNAGKPAKPESYPLEEEWMEIAAELI
ncbi:MAG: hypothetical protein ACO3SO_01290 [Luteolibacter sp.]|jgi:hypothetical protein